MWKSMPFYAQIVKFGPISTPVKLFWGAKWRGGGKKILFWEMPPMPPVVPPLFILQQKGVNGGGQLYMCAKPTVSRWGDNTSYVKKKVICLGEHKTMEPSTGSMIKHYYLWVLTLIASSLPQRQFIFGKEIFTGCRHGLDVI